MNSTNMTTVISSILIGVVLIIGYPIAYKMSADEIEITVKNKERITSGSGENISSRYLVYTDNEVFENTDSFLFWKFKSADLQNSLEIGQTYTVRVAGWRIPILSWFRNIIEINAPPVTDNV